MARRKETEKHPAVAIEAFERQVDSLSLSRNAKKIPFWDDLTKYQRDVLLLVPRMGSAAHAASYLGFRGQEWIDTQKQLCPEFSDALDHVDDWRDEIYASRIQELVGVALIELEQSITQGTNLNARMNAINTLMKISGRLRENTVQQTVVNGSFVHPASIQMYDKPTPPSLNGNGAKIIEVVDESADVYASAD
jgi:hypothetical protein